jgi:glutamine---fructose-6-phosphate transaminase (isomerizing)
MDNTGRAIKGQYHRDLMSQADVLFGLIERLETTSLDSRLLDRLRSGAFGNVVLTGMGSSLHACYPIHRALHGAGYSSHWIESSELLLGYEPLYSQDTLLIAVSQSGESAEVALLSKRAKEFGHFIGVTNHPDSSLGKAATSVLPMHAGVEATVSCKTYLSTLAVLRWLEGVWLEDRPSSESVTSVALEELKLAAQAVADYLKDWPRHVDEWLNLIDGVSSVFVTGRGNSLATSGTGGLILKESTRIHCEGMSAAAFRHGPMEMAGKQVMVVIFEGDHRTADLHRRLASDICQNGGRAILVGKSETTFRIPELPESVRPIIEILPIQMLSLAFARRDGIEAGRFERASKVTSVL